MGQAFRGDPVLHVFSLGLGGRMDLQASPGRRLFTLPGFAFLHCSLLGGDVQAWEMFPLAELWFLCLPWQRFCPEADAKNMLQCLKQNKNSEVMDPKCKQMITKRQITQNTGNDLGLPGTRTGWPAFIRGRILFARQGNLRSGL